MGRQRCGKQRGMRTPLLVLVFTLAGCASYRPLERSQWVLVWTDETVSTQMVNGTPIEIVKPTPGAKKEVIPQERFDAEIAEGKRRKAAASLGETPKSIVEVPSPIELMVGEVRELLIPAKEEPEVAVLGDSVRTYLTKTHDVADWKNGEAADRKESSLFVVADEGGITKIRVTYPGKEPLLIEVSVHER